VREPLEAEGFIVDRLERRFAGFVERVSDTAQARCRCGLDSEQDHAACVSRSWVLRPI
jgi:hypothetical protein